MVEQDPSTGRDSRRKRRTLVIATALALVAACQSDSGPEVETGSKATGILLPSDEAILSKVYSGDPRTPAGFYRDPALTAAGGGVTVRHIDTVSVLDPASPDTAAVVPYELCTDDPAQAMDWSESDHRFRTESGDLVATAETDRYFEFTRALTAVPDWAGLARVFKCSFLDRSGANRRDVTGPAGRLNVRPMSAASLKAVTEYLWTFSQFNNHANVVLATATAETADAWRHTLTMATLTPGAGSDSGCDLVEVRDWEMSVDRGDGELSWALRPVKTLSASRGDGVAQVCD